MIIINRCFIIGKINTNLEYKFIINNKNTAVILFNVELHNKSIVKIKGYNNIADWCYKELKKGSSILIEGYLNKKMEVIILSVCHWGRSLLTILLIKVHYILYYKQFVPNSD